MGQTLSEPVKDKHSSEGRSQRFLYAASAMQGWRITMEDAHTTVSDLLAQGVSIDAAEHLGFFAVFDGHGGHTVAQVAGKRLHEVIAAQPQFAEKNYPAALKAAFLELDQQLKNDPEFNCDPAGCTAVTALITPDRIIVANAGDSRAVLGQNGHALALSEDHKPSDPHEEARINAAGGFVEFGRVNGNLALSRALGDFEFKASPNLPAEQQIVTANPDVHNHLIDENDEFLVIACDGIWDCVSNQDCITYVRYHISRGRDLKWICEQLMEMCVAPDAELGGLGCDNMTVVIVGLLHGRSEEEWFSWVKQRYEAAAETNPKEIAFARRTVPLSDEAIVAAVEPVAPIAIAAPDGVTIPIRPKVNEPAEGDREAYT